MREVEQLFESLDPYPFRDKDLDRDAEQFIVEWARELPRDRAIEIAVHMPGAEAAKEAAKEMPGALRQNFRHRAEAATSELRELFRFGRVATIVGLSVLTACVIASQYVEKVLGAGSLTRVVEESLIILGWVANWRPLEVFLYEWWPIARRRSLYNRLAEAKVSINPPDGHAPGSDTSSSSQRSAASSV